jgi:hypothetical protein
MRVKQPFLGPDLPITNNHRLTTARGLPCTHANATETETNRLISMAARCGRRIRGRRDGRARRDDASCWVGSSMAIGSPRVRGDGAARSSPVMVVFGSPHGRRDDSQIDRSTVSVIGSPPRVRGRLHARSDVIRPVRTIPRVRGNDNLGLARHDQRRSLPDDQWRPRPDRAGRHKVPVPGIHEPGSDRTRPQAVDQPPVESRPERLRRPPECGMQVTTEEETALITTDP